MSPTSYQLLHSAIFWEIPDGAGDRARTGTVSLPRDFKSLVSTNSTTPANIGMVDSDMEKGEQPVHMATLPQNIDEVVKMLA